MALEINCLLKENRVLIEARLKPLQGHRFQPTGFPNLGAATYCLPDGTNMLLVESSQSMANRLEDVCWDYTAEEMVGELNGMPYVRVTDKNTGVFLTSSILEAHRISSAYILEGQDDRFLKKLCRDLSTSGVSMPVDLARLAGTVFRYDPGALLHGIFFAKKEIAGGRMRLKRLLSAFVEAENINPVESGGVKNDRVNPSPAPGEVEKGFGNVPFHRTEYTAERITAYFNLDLSSFRGYGLGDNAESLLIYLAFWKIRRFLAKGLRLRTACDLGCQEIIVSHPQGLTLPTEGELTRGVKEKITACAGEKLFVNPPVTNVFWDKKKKQDNC